MTTLAEHLRSTGVDISRPVGVIVERIDSDGELIPENARVVSVLTELPKDKQNCTEAADFDPEFCLCVTWPGSEDFQVALFRLTEGAVLFAVSPGGMILQTDFEIVNFGQTAEFMDKVREIWSQAEGILRAD